MSILQPMTSLPAFVKAGFLGFAGSGKTYTATELALGIREHFELDGPLAFFDTENGSDYIRKRVENETGVPLLGHKGRNVDETVEFLNACAVEGVSVAIVDSVTHLWRNVIEGYISETNRMYAKRGWSKKKEGLEFQDWGPIKRKWAPLADLVINAPLHLIICGRAGYEYDFEEDEKGKKKLVKTGIKMKTEGEFGFEPSLIIEMSRDEDFETRRIVRTALVTKDRFGVLDGKTCAQPDRKFFRPHLEMLTPGSHQAVDTSAPGFDVDEGGDGWAKERQQRVILCEEIKGELTAAYPTQSSTDKKAKADLIFTHLNTRSWTQVERTNSRRLAAALDGIREELLERNAAEETAEEVTQ